MKRKADDKANLDPVFLKFGQKVYTYDYACELREGVLKAKTTRKPVKYLIPQEGFQEKVMIADADLLVVGGKKGGGKSWVALYKSMKYMLNPDIAMYAFRKTLDDVKRGPWQSCKPIFRGFGTRKEATFEFAFFDGAGATMKMEHLEDLDKIKDRFRGAEMAYIDLEELPEHTRENLNIIFDFLAVNRNTCGEPSQIIATCNPVGWSNKLRKFLDYYIDPETDTVIPERSGKKRYMFKYGPDDTQIAWGNTWQEVYNHPLAKAKIDLLLLGREEMSPRDLIMTVQFIEGDYSENKILQKTDKTYISKLASKGDGSVINDLSGVWRDVDSGQTLLSMDEIRAFYNNSVKTDGIMRASADVALTGDFFVIYAFDGHHICDMEAWRGVLSDDIVPFIEKFLKKNGVRKDNFTYDANGLGSWIKSDSRFRNSKPFNNKSAPSDSRMWNNLKSESAEKFVHAIKHGDFSIEAEILNKRFTDNKGNTFSFADRFMAERMALKRKDNIARFEIIDKAQMKLEVGHSPDFLEGLFMVMPLYEKISKPERKGFNIWL